MRGAVSKRPARKPSGPSGPKEAQCETPRDFCGDASAPNFRRGPSAGSLSFLTERRNESIPRPYGQKACRRSPAQKRRRRDGSEPHRQKRLRAGRRGRRAGLPDGSRQGPGAARGRASRSFGRVPKGGALSEVHGPSRHRRQDRLVGTDRLRKSARSRVRLRTRTARARARRAFGLLAPSRSGGEECARLRFRVGEPFRGRSGGRVDERRIRGLRDSSRSPLPRASGRGDEPLRRRRAGAAPARRREALLPRAPLGARARAHRRRAGPRVARAGDGDDLHRRRKASARPPRLLGLAPLFDRGRRGTRPAHGGAPFELCRNARASAKGRGRREGRIRWRG